MKFNVSTERCLLLLSVILLSYSVRSLSVNEDTLDSDRLKVFTTIKDSNSSAHLPGLDGFDGINIDVYRIFTSFVNQTRQTIPLIANHGNFTMIQLGLLCAIGAMAAGVATVVAEAVTFRQYETDLEQYKLLMAQHTHHPPSHSNVIPHDSYQLANIKNKNPLKRRSKRDVESNGAPTFSYPQIVKSYGLEHGHHRSPVPSLQQLYHNIGGLQLGGQQAASSSIHFQHNPFNQNVLQGPQGGLTSAFLAQHYPRRRPQLGTSKHHGPRVRTRDPSNYEELYRGLPVSNDHRHHEYRSDRKKIQKRKKNDFLENKEYGIGSNRRNGKHSHVKIRQDESVGNYKIYN